ncbi:hypothetical protein MRX96_003818 [Rhipicephalus microplus]
MSTAFLCCDRPEAGRALSSPRVVLRGVVRAEDHFASREEQCTHGCAFRFTSALIIGLEQLRRRLLATCLAQQRAEQRVRWLELRRGPLPLCTDRQVGVEGRPGGTATLAFCVQPFAVR